MRKTHSANIGGTVFQIDDDAYELLQSYLQSIEAHFRSYPDVADIVADIEGRIAEQLLQREQSPQVVRMADVERVIAAMGRTEQFADPAAAPAPESQGRKLFRDPEHAIIAGVAAGLAAYMGAPRLLVRVAFLLLTFFFGTGAIAYLLLWALVPAASSTTDRLQMRGHPLTLASIDQGVRDGIAAFTPATRNAATRGITAVGSLIHLVVVSIARALKWVAGVFVVAGATTGMLFLTVVLVVALVNAGAPPLHQGVAEFFASFGSWQGVFKVCAYLLVAIPLALVITTALKLFWGVRRLNTRGLAGMLGVWVVSLLAVAILWSGSYPALQRYFDEYPATAEARRGVERFQALFAATSPLSADQSAALMATLSAEYKRSSAEREDLKRYSRYYYDPLAQLELDAETIRVREESNQRVVQSAQSYLDAEQLGLMQESMARYSAWTQASLQARRDRLGMATP